MFRDVPMSQRPELVNIKKAGGSDFDHPRAVSSSGKVLYNKNGRQNGTNLRHLTEKLT